jgi:hypothetical protein
MLAVIRQFLGVVAICAGVVLCSGSAAIASPFITPHGVGGLRLGATVKVLHRKGLIGGLRKGCELDRGQRIAPLRGPLSGWAVFRSGRKRLSAVTIEGGAETARHIGVGSTAAEARDAYPDALYEAPGTAKPFAEGFLWVPSLSKPKLTMIVEPGSLQVEAISVPSPNFCE